MRLSFEVMNTMGDKFSFNLKLHERVIDPIRVLNLVLSVLATLNKEIKLFVEPAIGMFYMSWLCHWLQDLKLFNGQTTPLQC